MSAEFDNSSEYQEPTLESLSTHVLRQIAEDTNEERLLKKIQFVVVERAFADREDKESEDLALYIEHKNYTRFQETFGQLALVFFQPSGPDIGDAEEARIALFKHTEE